MVFGILLLAISTINGEDSSKIRSQFAQPPREYSTGPLWVWNDRLSEKQIRETMNDFASQHVKQVWVHPRPGLMTPYLSEEWFHLWEIALDEAKKLDMNVWIYDENSYPSGYAGGLVPEAMPESRGQGLILEARKASNIGKEFLAVYRLKGNGFLNVTKEARSGKKLPEGDYLVASVYLAKKQDRFAGQFYVDLTLPGVTEKFIEITMEPYRKRFGDQFGKRIPGWFTDEPHLGPAFRGIHWNKLTVKQFKARWGYDLMDHLPSLTLPVGEWERVRHNLFQFQLEKFIERWSKPCYEYCEKHGLEFTGHYWEHGWPLATHGGDNMAMYAWHQRPGIDCLFNQYKEGVHSQFGNVRSLRELISVANQLGQKRTLCEAFGGSGWDFRTEDMKRYGDFLYVLGVNTLNEHLSYITMRGARKGDYPPSFSYHEPWWEAYHKIADYFTRLSLVMSEGQQVNHILLLEPTTTTWMYQNDRTKKEQLSKLGDSFQDMLNSLERVQVEYDLGCEDIISRHGSFGKNKYEKPSFIIGQRKYDLVVFPPHTINLNSGTVDLLEKYIQAGGTVLCCGDPPSRLDGQISDRCSRLASSSHWKKVTVEQAQEKMVKRSNEDGLVIQRKEGDKGILFHHRRRLDDGEILFLANTSIEHPSSGTILSQMHGAEQLDLARGTITACSFVTTKNGTLHHFNLPPCGSLLLFLKKEKNAAVSLPENKITTISPQSPPLIHRDGPNVLTLDYVDVTAGGKSKKSLLMHKAQKFVFNQNGMQRNPWGHFVIQAHDEYISKKFPPKSGFEATYQFKIEGQVPKPLHIVIERPDLYKISCNGKPVAAVEGDWWLDKSFGKVNLTEVAQAGENTVTIKASPFTVYHELARAYVLGDFHLKTADSGFVIIPPVPLKMGMKKSDDRNSPSAGEGIGWNEQGLPLYGHGVTYSESFNVSKPDGRYLVSLPQWYGSVAKVTVNGHFTDYIISKPWECDVTKWIEKGENKVDVTIIGTLKNMLGPHHTNDPLRGKAWPNAFRVGPENGPPPGDKYDTIGYGLFEPFVLKQVVEVR